MKVLAEVRKFLCDRKEFAVRAVSLILFGFFMHAAGAFAADYPTKTIQIINPFPRSCHRCHSAHRCAENVGIIRSTGRHC